MGHSLSARLLLLFFLLASHSLLCFSNSIPSTVDFPLHPCPSVIGCTCLNDDVISVECLGVGRSAISQLSVHYPRLEKLYIRGWNSRSILLDDFSQFPSLTNLSIVDGHIDSIQLRKNISSIKHLYLDSNWFWNWNQICSIVDEFTTLETLSLSKNYFTQLDNCVEDMMVQSLILSHNQITNINGSFHTSLKSLDISFNKLHVLDNLPVNIQRLNASWNPIESFNMLRFPTLISLDLSGSRLYYSMDLDAPNLEELYIDSTDLRILDLSHMKIPKLNRLSAKNSVEMVVVTGKLPIAIKNFAITNPKLTSLPANLFENTEPKEVIVKGIPFNCDPCLLQWTSPVKQLVREQIKCELPTPSTTTNCTIGVSKTQSEFVTAKHGERAILSCSVYGIPLPTIQWYLYRPNTLLGSFDPSTGEIIKGNGTEDILNKVSIIGGGALLIHFADRSVVERYVCVAKNRHGSAFGIIHFRLDYSDWYTMNVFHSVFYGGLASAVLVCAASFLLNITWILTRKSILWWIQRAERLSRVRKMVEAMEKYRSRQMDNLHDRYQKRVQVVRDNYHQQVEQLRISYTSQAEKFRDYRAAQMETVTSHLENIRENYNQQMQRVREFGSKRAEMLWESYERQVNRMRTFNLQHRLKMMRQYKVKQRYLNKLLESFQESHSPESLRKHEQEVRAALELPDPPQVGDTEMPEMPISRSASFYSLPEFVIGEDGVLRPSPLVPSVRYTTRDVRSPTTGSSSDSRRSHIPSDPNQPSTSSTNL